MGPPSFSARATQVALVLPESLSEEDWREVGRRLNSVERSVMWWLGDWWAFGERKGYGERKRIVEAEEWEGPSYEVCRNAGYVARRIEASCRHDALPWSTHAEIARIEDDAERAALLGRAATEQWTKREARAEVARHKNAAAVGAPVASSETCTVADLWRLVETGQRFGAI